VEICLVNNASLAAVKHRLRLELIGPILAA
jgi:hypothetical protein